MVNAKWTRRYLIIVRAAHRDAANTKYANVDTDGDGDKTFSIPLARTATPTTVVAYATNTLVTAEMVTRYAAHILKLEDAGHVLIYRIDAGGDWTVASALADAWPGGLVVADVA